MFKGFSIRQGEETFIKAVYFALEQACLEGKVRFYRCNHYPLNFGTITARYPQKSKPESIYRGTAHHSGMLGLE